MILSSSILSRKAPITSREEYLRLAKLHHPDNGGSQQEMAHINVLYSEDYVPPNQIYIPDLNLKYNWITHPHPTLWVGAKSAYYTPTLKHVVNYKFPDTKVQNEIQKYLPVYLRQTDHCLIVGKPPEQYSLLDHLPKFVGTPHASWIISSLYNILCYLEWAGTTHNAILTENIFFDPRAHSAHLYGGWWFAADNGATLQALPKGVYDLDPKLAKAKIATHVFDLKAIKRLGLGLLGDKTGMSLDQSDPKVKFLRSPTSGSARTDYKNWVASLGTRKFVELKL